MAAGFPGLSRPPAAEAGSSPCAAGAGTPAGHPAAVSLSQASTGVLGVAGVTQPSHSTAFCGGTGDLGLGGIWSWAVSPPTGTETSVPFRAPLRWPVCRGPLPRSSPALVSPHADCDSCCPLPVLCTRHRACPQEAPSKQPLKEKEGLLVLLPLCLDAASPGENIYVNFSSSFWGHCTVSQQEKDKTTVLFYIRDYVCI